MAAQHGTPSRSGFALQSRTAIVTGGSRGIGRAIALRLARDGANVVVTARTAADAEQVVGEITDAGGTSLAVACDVKSSTDVKHLVAQTIERFGSVDIVVNNAGISPKNVEPQEIDEETWDAILDTNLKGVFLCSQRAGRTMVERRTGRIVNIASAAGLIPALERAATAPVKQA